MLSACNNESNFIIPADFSLVFPDSTRISKGITEKEQQEIAGQFLKILSANTIDHEIPSITVNDLGGKSIDLKSRLEGIKLVMASSVTCEWDLEGILRDFPQANQTVANPIDKSEIIVLIQKEDNEYFIEQYQGNLEELKNHYSSIYLVDSLQAMQLNIFGLTRYYISEQNIVRDIGRGTGFNEEVVRFEIERNTVDNKRK